MTESVNLPSNSEMKGIAVVSTGEIRLMEQDKHSTLRLLSANPVESEAEVVYLLVEVRKAIDLMAGRFDALKFFCDWVLHPSLDRSEARAVIRTFDDYAGFAFTRRSIPQGLSAAVSKLISLGEFRDDLFIFLGEHQLDGSLVSDLRRLGKFLALYVSIISRTPLLPGNSTLKYIDRVQVHKIATHCSPGAAADETFMFAIQWVFTKSGVECMSLVNEIWFPLKPKTVSVTIMKLGSKDGQLVKIPQESMAFSKRKP